MKQLSHRQQQLLFVCAALLLLSLVWCYQPSRIQALRQCDKQILEHYEELGMVDPRGTLSDPLPYWRNLRTCLQNKCLKARGHKPSKVCILSSKDAPIYNAFMSQ